MKTLQTAVMTMAMTVMALAMSGCGAAAPETKGRWKSVAPEAMGNGSFSTRDFTLTEKTWALVFTIYGDAEAKQPLVALGFEGPWKVTGPSKVEGAWEALFEFKKKTITLENAGAAKNLGMDGCGLVVAQAKDVSEVGCSFVAPVEKYGREFDLVARKGEQLFLGARPADGDMGTADKRPTALGAPLALLK